MDDFCQDTSTDSEWAAMSDVSPFEPLPSPPKYWANDIGVFVREIAEIAIGGAPLAADASTLPGEVLTTEVTNNQQQRSSLLSLLRKLAVHEAVSPATMQAAVSFFSSLPRVARLPLIGPAGDGALALEWPEGEELGTLLTIDGDVFHYVLNAGSDLASYHDNVPLGRHLPADLLQAIQG